MFVVCCVGSVLCDGLITHSEELYQMCVCVIYKISTRPFRLDLGSCATEILCGEDRKYSSVFVLFSLPCSKFPFLGSKYLPR